jgi:hypothetical protein
LWGIEQHVAVTCHKKLENADIWATANLHAAKYNLAVAHPGFVDVQKNLIDMFFLIDYLLQN